MSALPAMALPDDNPDRRAAAICRAHGRTVRRRAARGRVPAAQPLGRQAPANAPTRSQAPSDPAAAGAAIGPQALFQQSRSHPAAADAAVRTGAPSRRPGRAQVPSSRASQGRAPSSRASQGRTPPGRTVALATSGRAAHGPAARCRSTDVPLRLTRRGRVVIAAAAAILVAVVSLVAAGAVQATSHSLPPRVARQNLSQVVVRPGQSLWSVAESADPHADTRLVVQQIIELNGLTGDVVAAGQRLWVPRG